jgi:hypothetical protein
MVNVGVMALARETGFSASAVSQKLKDGQTPDEIRAAGARKQGRNPSKTPQKRTSRGAGRPPLASEYDLVVKGRERYDALDSAKLRRAQALAERSELENALKRGELIPVAYVRQWASRFLTDGRDMMLTGPSELADALAAETDPLKTAEILRRWLERVLGKFQSLDRLWGAGDEERVA